MENSKINRLSKNVEQKKILILKLTKKLTLLINFKNDQMKRSIAKNI